MPIQKKLLTAVLVAAGAMGPHLAHADLIRTFDMSGSFQDGASLGGTVTIDVTTGTITGAALNLGTPIGASITTGTQTLAVYTGGASAVRYFSTIPNSAITLAGDTLYLDFKTTSLVGYGGGTLYSTTDPGTIINGTPYGSEIADHYGTLQTQLVTGAVSAVPEPSGLALLAAGLFGLGLIARRKQRHT